jgi:hypothetical protein
MAEPPSSRRLVSDEQTQGIVDAYQRGDKLLDIEREFGVPRATVYWVLERADVAPSRAKRGRRLVGDDQLLAQLYDVIDAQAARIRELEETLGIDTDS